MSEKDNKAQSVFEDDGSEPLTITNFILAHDARKWGYDWTNYVDHEKPIKAIFTDAQDDAFDEDEYVLDEAKKKKKKVKKVKKSKKRKKKASRKTSPVASQEEQPVSRLELERQPNVETNSEDPNVFSSNPEINRCPAFINGICRVDGRPCPFDNMDYRDCGKYRL